ncbi:hypothetical protein ACTHGU_21520 [Chitinophagaceae bacterium MMS25-I14]
MNKTAISAILLLLSIVTSYGQSVAKGKDLKNKKWLGNYAIWVSYGKIGGITAGLDIVINVTKDSILAKGDGYEMGFIDILTATENSNKLILHFKKNIYGYTQGKSMSPEFIITNVKDKYYLETAWIDQDVITKRTKYGYKIDTKR